MKDRTSILYYFVKSQENTKQKDLLRYEPTICPYRTSGCGMYLVVKEDRVVGVEPKKDYPLNEGETCIKGGSAYKFFDHPDRLWTPLVHGKACSWEEAFSPVAEKFSSVGPEEFEVLGSGKTSTRRATCFRSLPAPSCTATTWSTAPGSAIPPPWQGSVLRWAAG